MSRVFLIAIERKFIWDWIIERNPLSWQLKLKPSPFHQQDSSPLFGLQRVLKPSAPSSRILPDVIETTLPTVRSARKQSAEEVPASPKLSRSKSAVIEIHAEMPDTAPKSDDRENVIAPQKSNVGSMKRGKSSRGQKFEVVGESEDKLKPKQSKHIGIIRSGTAFATATTPETDKERRRRERKEKKKLEKEEKERKRQEEEEKERSQSQSISAKWTRFLDRVLHIVITPHRDRCVEYLQRKPWRQDSKSKMRKGINRMRSVVLNRLASPL